MDDDLELLGHGRFVASVEARGKRRSQALAKTTAIPRTVWTLGLVSLCMDTSSELIHSLLPVFLVGTLGASPAFLGLVEGVAEATSSITKVFSGWLSDVLGKRKLLAVLGYGLAAASKPIFPLASTPLQVLGARFVDRIGKGIRGAPRDALVADVTPAEVRGAAFGLRQALDTVGAFLGPALAIGLMALLADDIRAVFWWAVVPGALAVVLLAAGVEEPKRESGRGAPARLPFSWREVRRLPAALWAVVIIGGVFALARFSEAFLILRARDAGLSLELTPLVLILMNLVYAAAATPAGRLSDRIDRRIVLAAGLGVLIAADAVLAWLGASLAGAMAGVALWGLHLALTQGLLAALVADAAPQEARGTAFGLYNLVSGLAFLAASLAAGELWTRIGPPATFLTGGALAVAALASLALMARKRATAS
jgi:MFS family permease